MRMPSGCRDDVLRQPGAASMRLPRQGFAHLAYVASGRDSQLSERAPALLRVGRPVGPTCTAACRLPAPPTYTAPAVVSSRSIAPPAIVGGIVRKGWARVVYARRVIVCIRRPCVIAIATTTPAVAVTVVTTTCTCWRAAHSKDSKGEGRAGEHEAIAQLATPRDRSPTCLKFGTQPRGGSADLLKRA
jgi:hypothetical protein